LYISSANRNYLAYRDFFIIAPYTHLLISLLLITIYDSFNGITPQNNANLYYTQARKQTPKERYRNVTDRRTDGRMDGQTDRQTDRFAIHAIKKVFHYNIYHNRFHYFADDTS